MEILDMKKIKIAQIGTSVNSHGNEIWNTFKKMPDVFEIVGYAFPENEREKFPNRAKDFDGYREMSVEEILSDPEIEAVAVETEEIYLTKYALMAARAGKHLHMEKPGGREIEKFRELIKTVKEKNLVFSVGYMYRFNPKVKEVMARVERGELGRIYSVEAHMNCAHQNDQREWIEAFPGGMLFFLGCHLIDLIYRIQGEPLEVIPLSTATGKDGINTDDFGMVVYKYPGGVSFAKTCDIERGGFLRRQLVVCGERGTIEIKPLEENGDGGLYTYYAECFDGDWHKPWATGKSELYDRYEDMIFNFAEMVRGKSNPYSYDYELGLYELLLRSCGMEI